MVTPGNGTGELGVIGAIGLDKGVLIPSKSPCQKLQERLAFQDTTEVFLYCVSSWLSGFTHMTLRFCLR